MTQHSSPKFQFQVEWGDTKIGFSEVSGLGMETEPIEYGEGANYESGVKLPSMGKYGNITLKRGAFRSKNDYINWCNTIKRDAVERRNLTVSLLNEEGEAVLAWKVKNAWPTKIQSTGPNADGNEIAIESIELAHEGLSIEDG